VPSACPSSLVMIVSLSARGRRRRSCRRLSHAPGSPSFRHTPLRLRWVGRQDLNLRPPGPQPAQPDYRGCGFGFLAPNSSA
jgi:hypothetical protein